jgi:hypothetical protein
MKGRLCLRWNVTKESKSNSNGCNWIRIVSSDYLSYYGRRYFGSALIVIADMTDMDGLVQRCVSCYARYPVTFS